MNETSRLIIELDNRTLETKFQMNTAPALRGAMIGSCEMAKNWIIQTLATENAQTANSQYPKFPLAKNSSLAENPGEKEITRDAALDFYALQMWELQKRIRAVRDADSRATFQVLLPRH